MLEIEKELYIPVRKLSLGQRMKSELLAALIHKPNILFLDEPTPVSYTHLTLPTTVDV